MIVGRASGRTVERDRNKYKIEKGGGEAVEICKRKVNVDTDDGDGRMTHTP